MKLCSKTIALFRKQKLDAEMAEEMRRHLEQRTRENFAAGLSPDKARYTARRQFGGVEQIKERVRNEQDCDGQTGLQGAIPARVSLAAGSCCIGEAPWR